jgi:hypothetical protein
MHALGGFVQPNTLDYSIFGVVQALWRWCCYVQQAKMGSDAFQNLSRSRQIESAEYIAYSDNYQSLIRRPYAMKELKTSYFVYFQRARCHCQFRRLDEKQSRVGCSATPRLIYFSPINQIHHCDHSTKYSLAISLPTKIRAFSPSKA